MSNVFEVQKEIYDAAVSAYFDAQMSLDIVDLDKHPLLAIALDCIDRGLLNGASIWDQLQYEIDTLTAIQFAINRFDDN